MCWVMRAMSRPKGDSLHECAGVSEANVNSHGLNTSKLRWIFGFIPER